MATSEGPNSPARIEKQIGCVEPYGLEGLDISEQLKVLGVANTRVRGEGPAEHKRRMIMARNKAVMERMGVFTSAQNLRNLLPAKPKVASRAPMRRNLVPTSDIKPRRSERNDGKKRCYVEVAPERYQYEERRSRAKMPSRVNREGGSKMVQMKQVFAIQSDYAVGKAADAAEAKVEECEQGRAFAKQMMPSNVSSGFWQQLPAAMSYAWPFPVEKIIELECDDASRKQSALKKEVGRTTWQYQEGENERRWPVKWLPKGGSAGFSGGWRGFAIDQELTPNDFVVWEVPADVPSDGLPTYIKIHLFRAENYETEESIKEVITFEEERQKQLNFSETLEEEEEEEAGEEADPTTEAADEAGPSQAPAAAAKGKKAAAATRSSRAVKAALVQEPASSSKADATVTRKRARESDKTDKAVVPAKEAKKGKKAAVAAKKAAKEAADTEAAAAPEKPTAASTRARKPSAIVVDLAQRRWEEEQERINKLAAQGKATEENFDVEVILGLEGMKTANPRFKMRWAGFAEEDDTWEPYSMFEDDVFQYAWADEKLRAEAQKFARRWRK